MRCLVLSQFQASLLGAFLGNTLGSTLGSTLGGKDLSSLIIAPTSSASLKLQAASSFTEHNVALSGLLRVAQMLIQSQSVQQVGWDRVWFQVEGKYPRKIEPSFGAAAVAVLPIALLFHESSVERDRQLQSISQAWWPCVLEIAQIEVMVALSGAVAFACLGILNPARLIPQILSRLSPNSILTNQLQQVQGFIERRDGLGTVLESMNQSLQDCKVSALHQLYRDSLAVSLAFYCFLDTPEDFSLTLLRAAHTSSFAPLTSIFSGMLSGAYNGLETIPVGWRSSLRQLNQGERVSQVEPEFSDDLEAVSPGFREPFGREEKILQLGSQLFALWSGAYNPATSNFQADCVTAVASASEI
ncbi:MAG: hypothetical protein ACRC8A_18820 [Microcoleaceae cyanobacterium]